MTESKKSPEATNWQNADTWVNDAGRLMGDSEPYSWEELQAIEERRRAVLKRVELPFWRILGYWDGTCLKVMVRDALLWGNLALYILVRILMRRGNLPVNLDNLDDINIDVIGGFLSFFLVLFVNQANVRFNAMYKSSMTCEEKILDIASVVTAYFPKANALRMVRYMNAAHVIAYVGLASGTYSKGSFFVPINSTRKLLTEKEMERINEIGMESSDSFCEVLMWAIREVRVMQEQKVIDARMSGELREKVQGFRHSMSALYHDKDQPIHFFYIHFLSLLTAFYVPLFAMTTAYGVGGKGEELNWTSEVLSALIVFLQAIFVIGLRLLGQVMVDPYGDDVEDLSVLHYVCSTWTMSNRILATKFPAELNANAEAEIEKTRASLGGAWDVGKVKSPVTFT